MLTLIAEGLSSRNIADVLSIAAFTVRKHRCNLLGKLGLRSTAQLTTYAMSRVARVDHAGRCLSTGSKLSRREQEVVALVAQGLTSKEVARRLGISPATVRKHRENASSRLGARGMAGMIRFFLDERAFEPSWVDDPPLAPLGATIRHRSYFQG